ncbi:MAG TPA: sigma-54 dependent transcriptional regulator [Candidatus Rikenella faecigallinarum]|uniref:Sigma-54 dependent transcriptional regulator n=1 Tax=Candidatus Rikenella faecigallinarum TaxID=2838745 RepID=A0A9D1QFK3_9BACT|nr:sigma-54 dependent transcriptional regulator [Candidatus Rikenella faecigallinarum]
MELQSVKQRFGIIGNTPALNRALEVALRVAPTDLSVLITGESGVGKEFFPQIIHAYSARKHGNYIAVNCGAIPEGTIDSELFGHEKGSFTGATDSRKGYFEVADGGTIFLDEVGELPLTTQVRLLRVLQSGEFIRVGSSKAQKTNVRVVAATNVNLRQAVKAGRFREDLYYRLNTVPITVPPLRERQGDIHLLFRKFSTDIAAQYHMPPITLTPDARKILESYRWPGNVRQLKNVAEQISAVEEQREIDPDTLLRYLPDYAAPTTQLMPLPANGSGEFANTTERDILYKLLFDLRGEVSELKGMVAELTAHQTHTATPHTTVGYPNTLPMKVGDTVLPAALVSSHPEASYIDTAAEEILPVEEAPADIRPAVPQTKEEAQREAIVQALRRNHGRRKEAARELFISERTLYRKIKELGIGDEDIRA